MFQIQWFIIILPPKMYQNSPFYPILSYFLRSLGPSHCTCGWLPVLRAEELPLLLDRSLGRTATHHDARQDHLFGAAEV